MKDKDLIKSINGAYDVKPSREGKAFIRVHQKRSLRVLDVFKMELRHINWLGVVILMLVLATSVFVCDRLPGVAWVYGSMMPMIVLLSVISFGRSERYGMSELESASRFSKTFLKMVRLVIAGVFSLIGITISSTVMYFTLKINENLIIMLLIIPFLITSYGSLLIIRKWHSGNNVYGCMALAIGCGSLPLFSNIRNCVQAVPLWGAVIIAVVLLAVNCRELVGYVQVESEELSWN